MGTHAHAHAHAHLHACTHAHMHTCTRAHVHMPMHMHMHMPMHMHMHMPMPMHMHTPTPMHVLAGALGLAADSTAAAQPVAVACAARAARLTHPGKWWVVSGGSSSPHSSRPHAPHMPACLACPYLLYGRRAPSPAWRRCCCTASRPTSPSRSADTISISPRPRPRPRPRPPPLMRSGAAVVRRPSPRRRWPRSPRS